MRPLPIKTLDMSNLELINVAGSGTDGKRILLTEKTNNKVKRAATALGAIIDMSETFLGLITEDSAGVEVSKFARKMIDDKQLRKNIKNILQ